MDLALIKQHLYIEHDEDDSILAMYASAAEKAITNYLQKDYDETNKIHEQSKLLLIGNFYANREASISGTMISEVPYGISFLLDSEMSVIC